MSAWILGFLALIIFGAAALIICAAAMAGLADRRADEFASELRPGSQARGVTPPAPPAPAAPSAVPPCTPTQSQAAPRGPDAASGTPAAQAAEQTGETSEAFPSATVRRFPPPADATGG